jgi:AmmeMemoRadiSam system protein A
MLPIGIAERRYALEIARRAILEHLGPGISVEHETDAPSLLQLRGVFVTLRRRDSGELRGCRGEYGPRRPLIESVIRQAISAATEDPRFSAVEERELAILSIRISALTPLKRIEPREIVLGRDGLVVQRGGRSGLLLPEVPKLFGLDSAAEFLEALYRKAGLAPDLDDQPGDGLFAFQTEAWGEEDFLED